MSFDLEELLKSMVAAAGEELADIGEDVSAELKQVLDNEKESLEMLKEAIVSGDIELSEFDEEVEREKLVVKAELLTIKIMVEAAAERAINAAFEVFTDTVKELLN
ncbi:hypothetical protein FLL45_04660 [Aliikangiella marina]|uniref:Uncharacterized protein n=1 Tax=Aliikangiella marina TaxID=1712262 RepID=A0A545TJ33_9GAMM|nr:hypothetical protein [Aliikangiella marina]TQV77242.1 hypothetical protein FLL45_04660 [Aliikangiella marina]